MNEVDTLAAALRSRFGHVALREDYGWPQNPVLSLIDCVLSLNRRYDTFALPRVQAFAKRRPEIIELAHLAEMLNSYPEVGAFSVQELNYNHADRERVLRGVLAYLLTAQADHAGISEWDRLRTWAVSVTPKDQVTVGVKGFALSGFQYLRMLLGAQTTKPDVHIMRFVSQTLGRRVNDWQALELLEAASARAGLLLREVDGAIWEAGARGTIRGE